jgi:hypothetical protein
MPLPGDLMRLRKGLVCPTYGSIMRANNDVVVLDAPVGDDESSALVSRVDDHNVLGEVPLGSLDFSDADERTPGGGGMLAYRYATEPFGDAANAGDRVKVISEQELEGGQLRIRLYTGQELVVPKLLLA